jgi:UDP-2-acetamido-3-amino-2,3-dideoxy-glucuronate N-acetyltransferase
MDFYAHPSAFVDQPCKIGSATRIGHFCHVLPEASIGAHCILEQNVYVASGVRIGNQVQIQNNVSLYTGVVIEDDVYLGPSCVFANISNPRTPPMESKVSTPRTLVRRGATVGANATIMCGTTIGQYAFIGAAAVVTADVPDYALVLGVPARQFGWMSRHGQRLGPPNPAGIFTCPVSGWRYRITNGVLRCLDCPEETPIPATAA